MIKIDEFFTYFIETFYKPVLLICFVCYVFTSISLLRKKEKISQKCFIVILNYEDLGEDFDIDNKTK